MGRAGSAFGGLSIVAGGAYFKWGKDSLNSGGSLKQPNCHRQSGLASCAAPQSASAKTKLCAPPSRVQSSLAAYASQPAGSLARAEREPQRASEQRRAALPIRTADSPAGGAQGERVVSTSPLAMPTLLQYFCTTIAQYTTPSRPPFCMPYAIQYWSWQYRVKAKLGPAP